MGCGTSKPPIVSSANQPQTRPKPEGKESASIGYESENERIGHDGESERVNTEQFTSLSYEEVAALRPTNPENMWAIVKKSSDTNRDWKLDSVKNRRGWKTIRLFVSSTFRDFHAEREALVKEVSSIFMLC